MNRNLVIGSMFLAGTSSVIAQKIEKKANIHSKPNIIYILADDMGYGDLSCYGQKRFKTPNIDRLAAEGMRFTQHYAGTSVSAPSRSSLLTGQTTGHTPVRGNLRYGDEGQWPLPAQSYTLAEMLKDAGYATGAFGKWGLGSTGTEGDPNSQGFDEFYGYKDQTIAHNYYPFYLWHNQEKVVLKENSDSLEGVYAPLLIHQKALSFIRANKKGKPFFLYYATTIPHAELTAPEKYMEQFRNKLLPEKTFPGVKSGRYKMGDYGPQSECHAAFAAMITLLDEQVGEIVAELKKQGLDKNTIIMFSSDNGPHQEGGGDPEYFDSNGPFRGYKRDLYEGGMREPMIAWWPGIIKPGKVTDHISAFWDVMPTCAELSGFKIPNGLDGISFLPTLLGKEQPQHDYLYWEFHELGGRMALRMGNWKIVRYNVTKAPGKPAELYDLSTDPGETKNVAADHPDLVQKMDSLMKSSRVPSKVFSF